MNERDDTYSRRLIDLASHHFVALDDGTMYYWARGVGSLSANDLRLLADELDRLNAPHPSIDTEWQ